MEIQVKRRSRRLRRLQPLGEPPMKGKSFKKASVKKHGFQVIYLHAISNENNVEIGFSVQNNVDPYIFRNFHRIFFDLPEFGQERDD